MSNRRLKTLLMGLSATALAFAAPPAQAASTIKVAVDSAFAKTANDLVSAFQYTYPSGGYSVVVTAGDSASLEASIIAGATYDLFLAGSPKQPTDLAANYPSLVAGATFKYAKDALALYSTTTDISSGLPFFLGKKVLVPDPATDPYGKLGAVAAALPPSLVLRIPGPRSAVSPNAGASLAALNFGAYPFGFVANSAICSLDASGQPSYDEGTYHHVYPLLAVTLTGVKLVATRTADQDAELNNFMAFLTGTVDVDGALSTAGTDVVSGHCFKIPSTP